MSHKIPAQKVYCATLYIFLLVYFPLIIHHCFFVFLLYCFLGITTQETMYPRTPGTIPVTTVIKIQTKRIRVESISKVSPIPPQTPAIFLSALDKYIFFFCMFFINLFISFINFLNSYVLPY